MIEPRRTIDRRTDAMERMVADVMAGGAKPYVIAEIGALLERVEHQALRKAELEAEAIMDDVDDATQRAILTMTAAAWLARALRIADLRATFVTWRAAQADAAIVLDRGRAWPTEAVVEKRWTEMAAEALASAATDVRPEANEAAE